jgi:RNA polymerase sigma-70 factor (ECF subfamily)
MDLEKGSLEAEPGNPQTMTRPPRVEDRPTLSRQTLERVTTRDTHALGMLFEFYFERIYGLAYRLLGDHTSAEDVAQDVFRKVYRAADQLDPSREPGPWLMSITHNVCRDYWRSRGYKLSRRTSSIDEHESLMATLPSSTDNPEQSTLKSERERQVRNAIMKLTEPLREVVVLHDYRGLSHEEIAVAVGASYAAVRKRYSRALAKLAGLLKDVMK